MVSFKKLLKESIQARLSFWLSAAILILAIVAGGFSFASAFDEAHELQDDVLRQVAALFDQQHLPRPHLGDGGRSQGSDEESRVIVQYLSGGNAPLKNDDPEIPLPLPKNLSDGLHTLILHGESFRVLVKTMASGERIAVAQETGMRDEIARDSALRTVTPFLILFPILLLVVADLVRKMFKPIARLSADIDSRCDHELHPIETESLPSEVRPFVVAINRLLDRVSNSMQAQQRFVADAAHELRSPLTALSLQAERLAGAPMSDSAHERLAALRKGIERGRALLDQLLTLARAQSSRARAPVIVSVGLIFQRVLEDLLPLAEAKNINIGVSGEADVPILADEVEMAALVKNLVDNAIRYTPEDGRIDLSVRASDVAVVLQIDDTGPGIAPAERDRVFDPFYRITGSQQQGSGLGLAIVRTIALRAGARVSLAYSDEPAQSGLRVSVAFPNPPRRP